MYSGRIRRPDQTEIGGASFKVCASIIYYDTLLECTAEKSKKRLIDSNFPKDPNRSFTHLRRFVKEDFLPEHLKIEITQRGISSSDDRNAEVPTIFALIQPPLPELSQLKELLAPFLPTTAEPTDEFSNQSIDKYFLTATIPLYPSLSAAQAEYWSKTLWPTTYNAAHARATIAPPPPVLSATQSNIASKAAMFLGLACEVAREAAALKRGRGIGVVAVDPAVASSNPCNITAEQGGEEAGIVAVAGDARFCAPGIEKSTENSSSSGGYNPNCEGGPECHAVMRVVEMIAIQRRSEDDSASEKKEKKHNPSLSPLEQRYLYQPADVEEQPASLVAGETTNSATRVLPRSAGGYLCTDLDIYITHEPCLSCSMGILLSRFRAVTFLRRGRLSSGGLASEPVPQSSTETNTNVPPQRENYYGLFWRKELNWRAMCFEFVEDDESESKIEGCEEPGEYHA